LNLVEKNLTHTFLHLLVANDRFYVKIVQYGRNGAIIFSQVMLCSAM
ncbi:hypothetical protein HMPREF3213_01811, partial [Heyndrickxia coagulans]